jgi:hypothetical protein
VEGTVQALLASADDTSLGKIRPCDIHKIVNLLKMRKTCGLDGILNKCLRHLPRRPLVYLIHLFNHCFWLSHFPKPWKEAKAIMLPNPVRTQNFLKVYAGLASSTTGMLLEKVILKRVQRHIEEKDLLNASQFGFHHSMTCQCIRLTNHVTLNFNNNMPMGAVFLDTEKAFDATWHLGLLFKLSTLQFSITLIKLIGSFLSQKKFKVSVKGEMPTPRDIQAEVPQGSVLSSTLYSLYITENDPNAWCLSRSLC